MKKILIVIGAGASFDCVNGMNTITKQENKPPLVNELFDLRFNDVIQRFPHVASSADEIRTLLKTKSIEEILFDFSKEKSKVLKKTFYYVPLYLQALFKNRINNYVPNRNATKYETLLRNLERSSYSEINIVTLNYDNFLERAFSLVFNVNFTQPLVKDDYLNINNKFNLFKLHGSSNWLRSAKYKEHITINQLIDLLEPHEELEFHDEFYNQSADGFNLVTNPDFIQYPAMSAPVKGSSKFNCPQYFINLVNNSLIETNDFLFIGFSARDKHIVDLFQSVSKVDKFLFVNGNLNFGKEALINLNKSTDSFAIDDFYIFNGGFSSFVESQKLKDFLEIK